MKYLPYIFIAMLLIANLFQWDKNSKLTETVAIEKQNVKNLAQEISNRDVEIFTLKGTFKKLEDSIPGLLAQIEAGKNEIKKIQKERDEKIKLVERYNISDMQLFFDRRYGTGKSK